jgi:hypothetical protein
VQRSSSRKDSGGLTVQVQMGDGALQPMYLSSLLALLNQNPTLPLIVQNVS